MFLQHNRDVGGKVYKVFGYALMPAAWADLRLRETPPTPADERCFGMPIFSDVEYPFPDMSPRPEIPADSETFIRMFRMRRIPQESL
jgi:hypothetical protein